MGELRKDPISGNWVLVAENRALRPQELLESQATRRGGACDFCQGHESETPAEVMVIPASGTGGQQGWQVRIVPNKYPAVGQNNSPGHFDQGLFQSRSAKGAHEVIIESPLHVTSVTDLSVDQFRTGLSAAAERLAWWRKQATYPYALLFKNVGAAAGASLEHLHSQLIALPLVPPLVLAELERVAAYRAEHKRCLLCDMIASERDSPQRLVMETPGFLAFCPYAGRFAYETWIVPKTHAAHFDTIGSDALDLAATLRELIARLEVVLDRPAYNYTLHTTPFDTNRSEDYHWHIKLMPRISKFAGLELATGIHINTVAPERAAPALRLASPTYPDHVN